MKRINGQEIKIRREIYEFISQNPGLHLRDISRRMNIPFSTLKYHLSSLEKRNIVSFEKQGKYERFFVSKKIGEEEKKIIGFLQKKEYLHIILWFYMVVQFSQKELARYMEKHPTTVGFHLRRLRQAGIVKVIPIENGMIVKESLPQTIERKQVSNEKIYVLSDPWLIYDIILKHRKNLVHHFLVDALIYYVEFYIHDGVPKKAQNREEVIDSIVETFTYFFFPPPFCS